MGGGETAGPPGLADLGAGEPIIIYGSTGLAFLEVECNRCETRASLPLVEIRRPRHTPIWKLEASLKCRSCRKGRYAPPVHMIRLTEKQQIAPCRWVHPNEER